MARINVLVFPCGAENALEIHQALKDVMNIDLFGASSRDDHGAYVFKNYTGGLPLFHEEHFWAAFDRLLEANSIDIVIPTHDDIALHLARNLDRIRPKVAVPGAAQAEVCRSKSATYAFLQNEDFVPQTFTTPASISAFPVFVKPDKGQGGKGARMVNDIAELQAIPNLGDYCICEHLTGEELTVDCFTDRHGALRFVGPRRRDRVFGGISVRTSMVELTEEIQHIAGRINTLMKLRGAWYFQLKKDAAGKFKLLEVSVRTAGSMGLYRSMGVNFPLLTVYDLLDMDVNIALNPGQMEMDRALFSRYRYDIPYEVIYVDYDETIIKRDGDVNWSVMLFLYNARARGKRIRLISKHAGDLHQSLEEHAIHEGLFEEVLHLQPEDTKCRHMRDTHIAVFIDNAFKERAEAQKLHGMPVFDVDAVVALVDWRE